jgi:hypothetical protein
MLNLLKQILRDKKNWKNLVLLDEKNRTILCWSEKNTEDLHLAISAENLLQFIRPQKNEIFVTNDFSAGCLSPGQISYLFQVCENSKGKIYGFLREEFLPLSPLPPVPLYQKNNFAEDLFGAIFSENSEKIFWRSHFEINFKTISDFSKRISIFFERQDFFEQRESFFNREKESIKFILSEKPFGSHSAFAQLEAKNLGKVTVTLDETKAHFDFSAPSATKGPCLPSSLSSSLAFSCFSQAYQLDGPFHHSHFSIIQTVKSPRSYFSSPYRSLDTLPSEKEVDDLETKIFQCIESIHRKQVLRKKVLAPSRLFFKHSNDLFEIESGLSASWGAPLRVKKNHKLIHFAEWLYHLRQAGSDIDKDNLKIRAHGPWDILHHSGPARFHSEESEIKTWNFRVSLVPYSVEPRP